MSANLFSGVNDVRVWCTLKLLCGFFERNIVQHHSFQCPQVVVWVGRPAETSMQQTKTKAKSFLWSLSLHKQPKLGHRSAWFLKPFIRSLMQISRPRNIKLWNCKLWFCCSVICASVQSYEFSTPKCASCYHRLCTHPLILQTTHASPFHCKRCRRRQQWKCHVNHSQQKHKEHCVVSCISRKA